MRLLKFLWWTCVTLICGVLLSFSGAYLYLSPSLPSVEALRNVQLQIPLKVYSEDGKLISEFGEMRRTPIRFADIPQDFIHALLSAEDDNFANHYGVDVKSLMRAAAQLLKSGHIQTGGSTITMQVAKNYFLTNERSFSRKINEILLALQIERSLTKDEILELYVNKIYLGNRAYGIEAAAQVYYGKSIKDLSLAQMAMIAGLPKAPSRYNPLANPDAQPGTAQLDPRAHAQARLHRPATLPGRHPGADQRLLPRADPRTECPLHRRDGPRRDGRPLRRRGLYRGLSRLHHRPQRPAGSRQPYRPARRPAWITTSATATAAPRPACRARPATPGARLSHSSARWAAWNQPSSSRSRKAVPW